MDLLMIMFRWRERLVTERVLGQQGLGQHYIVDVESLQHIRKVLLMDLLRENRHRFYVVIEEEAVEM